METITIHPKSEKQINLLKSLLDELKIKFEINPKIKLTENQKRDIDLGIRDFEDGKFSSSAEVREKARIFS